MSFYFGVRTATTFADVKIRIGEALVLAGWTDLGGNAYSSVADAQGRKCYVRFSEEVAGDTYFKIETARDVGFTTGLITKYAYLTDAMTFPDNDLCIYANEYWCCFYSVTNDGTTIYPSFFGLYEPKEGSTLIGEPNCHFQGSPRDAAGGGASAVKWHDPAGTRFEYFNGLAGLDHGSICGLGDNTNSFANNTSTSPNRKLAVAPMLRNNTKWIGTLYYAVFVPYPALITGDQANEYGTVYYYDIFPNANDYKDNLYIRIE